MRIKLRKDEAWKLKKKKLLKQSRLILLQKTNITNYNQRKYGYDKALEYIGFCVGNYKYKVSTLGGITQFIKDLLDYLKNGYRMNNMYDLSFNEWIKKNKE